MFTRTGSEQVRTVRPCGGRCMGSWGQADVEGALSWPCRGDPFLAGSLFPGGGSLLSSPTSASALDCGFSGLLFLETPS